MFFIFFYLSLLHIILILLFWPLTNGKDKAEHVVDFLNVHITLLFMALVVIFLCFDSLCNFDNEIIYIVLFDFYLFILFIIINLYDIQKSCYC